jgi:osmotically-inducible protein OsmY
MKKIVVLFGMIFISIIISYSQTKLVDRYIADAIEDEYHFDHAINVNRINVNVIDGIVELTGVVDNLKAKERAANIAQLIKGVRSVSNRIVVDPPDTLTDEKILSMVKDAILVNPATYLFEIDVTVYNGVVSLVGTVDSYQKKELCGNIAKSVNGVIDLNNDIKVHYKLSRPDYELKNEIEQALKWNASVRDGLIDVKVTDGIVELSGMVGSRAEKSNAFSTAWVSGVKTVDNSGLEVRWMLKNEHLLKNKDVAITDTEIEEAINDAALHDPRVFSFNVTPESNNGLVTLRGKVDNLTAKKTAENLARNTTGVRGVKNRIKVRMSNPPEDSDIQANINTALLNNSITASWKINVRVNNGIVTLSGVVDSYLEKTEAELVANSVRGVSDVNNIISVDYPFAYYFLDNNLNYDLFVDPPVLKEVPADNFPNDQYIQERVENKLYWSPFVNSEQIIVEVENGNVTLKGTVDSWQEYQKAAENAWKGGAWAITNKLIVR